MHRQKTNSNSMITFISAHKVDRTCTYKNYVITWFLARVFSHPLIPSSSFRMRAVATARSSSVIFGSATMASCSIFNLYRVGKRRSSTSNRVFQTRTSVVWGAHVVISTPEASQVATSKSTLSAFANCARNQIETGKVLIGSDGLM
jgi:hypothetical protein